MKAIGKATGKAQTPFVCYNLGKPPHQIQTPVQAPKSTKDDLWMSAHPLLSHVHTSCSKLDSWSKVTSPDHAFFQSLAF